MNLLTESVANASVVSGLSTIAGEMVATVNAVAPVVVPVLGVYMVWKAGVKMFKTLAGK